VGGDVRICFEESTHTQKFFMKMTLKDIRNTLMVICEPRGGPRVVKVIGNGECGLSE
jgi:hypothetical protein